MNYSLNFADVTPELFKLSPGARQQSSAAHHAGRQEQGGDRVLNASHRTSPCVSLDRQPTGQSHHVAETQSALAQLSRMCASAHTSPRRFGIPITPKAELRQEGLP